MGMSEIEQLLRRVARSHDTAPSADVIEADVRRGRAALARRRRRRAVWSAAICALAAAAIVSGALLGGRSPVRPTAPNAENQQTSTPQEPGAGHNQGSGGQHASAHKVA